jgi:CRP-like cAMP-binding protein
MSQHRLSALTVFRGVPEADLQAFEALCTPVNLGVGHVIFRTGEAADSAMLLVSGRLVASVGGRELGEIHPGELLGELGLLGRGQRRSADVSAREPSFALLLPPNPLASGDRNLAVVAIERHLLATLARRIRRTNQALSSVWRDDGPAQPSAAAVSPSSPAPSLRSRLARLFGGA